MIPTYGGVLSAIEKALRELVEEYRGVGRSLQDLVEGQERNMAQLERIGATIEQRWSLKGEVGKEESRNDMGGLRMALEKVRRRELCRPPPVRLVVSCFFFNRIFYFL